MFKAGMSKVAIPTNTSMNPILFSGRFTLKAVVCTEICKPFISPQSWAAEPYMMVVATTLAKRATAGAAWTIFLPYLR